MTRVKRGSVARKRREKILDLAKGFRGSHSKLFQTSNQQVMKSLRYSYADRRKKKNQFKRLWIQRINSAARTQNLPYNKFVSKLKISKINLNKKILSKISYIDMKTFSMLTK
uniref:Large ribosomal subunit protein bL20c n=1 Tax=Monomorphina parapyrum TaxID=1664066 RepID=A0A0G3VIF3_9EUGL|nr:ribosomal protein L20 [Monomorphina parapyrum]AKL78963.1 ribosomal protein L20 [Monomorphina parapyrum]